MPGDSRRRQRLTRTSCPPAKFRQTFTQRQELVAQAVELYLDPYLTGRDVQQVTDIQRAATHSSYWRSGPVLNNAVSGVDQALWVRAASLPRPRANKKCPSPC